MEPRERHEALRTLVAARPDGPLLCREAEAYAHAVAYDAIDYHDLVLRVAHRLRSNPALDDPAELVHAPDGDLIRGTEYEAAEHEKMARAARFHAMLQEKYDAINDRAYTAIVRCRRCGSGEVSWEEKQTRSADEAMSLFCVCLSCKTRWVVR